MKTIYLHEPWGRFRAGTALAVLAEREPPGSSPNYVDAGRAEQLLRSKVAGDNPPAKPQAPATRPPVAKES